MQIKRYLSDVDETMNHKIALEKRRELAKNFIKPKDESTESPKRPRGRPKKIGLDKWYKDRSHQDCISLTALYLAVHDKNIRKETIKSNYGVSHNTFFKYRYWYRNEMTYKSNHINSFIVMHRDQLVADMKKAPAPTVKEVKRLFAIGNPVRLDIVSGVVKESRSQKTLNDKQKDQLFEVVELEKPQPNHLNATKGVILGAVTGSIVTALIFLTNGAI